MKHGEASDGKYFIQKRKKNEHETFRDILSVKWIKKTILSHNIFLYESKTASIYWETSIPGFIDIAIFNSKKGNIHFQIKNVFFILLFESCKE